MDSEASETYRRLKAELIISGRLFEDAEFPARGSSIGGRFEKNRNIKWLRPPEIVYDPQLIIKGMTRDDIFQGEIRDCFILAAAACVAVTKPSLLYRVVPPGQNFNLQYTGMFRFNFYRYDRWVEVIIDDRLPTVDGELIMSRNRNSDSKNEFWVALMEKAYAKMNGSYMNIDTGFINEAMVDLTGGISEIVDVQKYRKRPEGLFKLMARTMDMSSFLGCAVNIEAQSLETSMENGLYSGHAYSITRLAKVKYEGNEVRLIRLRNPWGRKEWSGAWGDRSSRWKKISDKVKDQLEFKSKEDGEFWMDFDDWIGEFAGLYFCHLTPDAFLDEIWRDSEQSGWKQVAFNGQWIPGESAGGCGNHPHKELFWINPQYLLTLDASEDGNGDGVITTIIMLSQKFQTDETNHYINFVVYKIRPRVATSPLRRFTEPELEQMGKRRDFINVRDVSDHYRFVPGDYVIIPCTFLPNQPGDYTLRLFTETNVPPQQIAFTLQGL